MLLQAEAEMFPALLEVFTPPLPTHIRLMEEFYASHFEETASGTLTISK